MACMYCGSEEHSSMACPTKDQDKVKREEDDFYDDDNEPFPDSDEFG